MLLDGIEQLVTTKCNSWGFPTDLVLHRPHSGRGVSLNGTLRQSNNPNEWMNEHTNEQQTNKEMNKRKNKQKNKQTKEKTKDKKKE